MLVQAILELIHYLKQEKELILCDYAFLEKLEQRFNNIEAQHRLSAEEMQFIDACCKERIQQLPNSNNDALTATSYWIDFASKFEISYQAHLISKYSNPLTPTTSLCMVEKSAIELKGPKVHPCWILIVSLLTTRFEVSALGKRTIWIWDKTNSVGKEPGALFDLLWPSIKSNHRERVEQSYNKFIKNAVEHEINDAGFVERCTRYESTTTWLLQVKEETLQETQAIHWFEPEVFLGALVDFKFNHSDVGNKVTEFLDQLISTYTQRKDELQKIVRVNVLFTEMMFELCPLGRQDLLTAILTFTEKDAKAHFIKNCERYLAMRLTQLSSSFHTKDSYSFFSSPNQGYSKVISSSGEIFRDVGQVIDCFKLKLNEYCAKSAPILYETLSHYLKGLSYPILSVAELERAQKSSNNAGYLGAWS